jgi:glycosyltransferase involved in cell wall biosynthesis
VSNYSKQQIENYRMVLDTKIDVISEAPGKEFRKLVPGEVVEAVRRFELKEDDPFLLYVGGISPHKNLGSLVKAFCRLKESFPALKLVLAGDYERDSFFSDFHQVTELAKNLRIMDHIVFTGYVTDSELAALYNAATLFVFPSFQEGFGLPAVEAMACGAPIAASSAGSLPEIIGNAGEFFDPSDPEEMFQTIARLLNDETLRHQLSEKGLQRVKQFDWNHAADQTILILEKMVGG